MNGLWTPQSAAITDPILLCPSQLDYGLHPAMFSGNDYVIVTPLSTVGYTSVVASVSHSGQWSN